MTPEDEKAILSLVHSPRDPSGGDPAAVLRHFGTEDGAELGRALLDQAICERNATDVELSLILHGRFGNDQEIQPQLLELATANWHFKHEDVISALGKLKTPDAVDALYHATQWVPEYLDYDEARALAHKAIWALGENPSPRAEDALTHLLTDFDASLHEAAARQLRRRAKARSAS